MLSKLVACMRRLEDDSQTFVIKFFITIKVKENYGNCLFILFLVIFVYNNSDSFFNAISQIKIKCFGIISSSLRQIPEIVLFESMHAFLQLSTISNIH